MHKVIVAVSDNDMGHPAIGWAKDYAASTRAIIELVHVVDLTWTNAPLDLLDVAMRGADQLLHEEVKAAAISHPGVVMTSRVTVGSPVAEIINAARRADLVVVGSHPGGTHRRASRQAIRLAALAPCTVVVVPADIRPGTGVVVGVDGSEDSRCAVDFAAEFADRVGERLTVIHSWNATEPWAFVEPLTMPIEPAEEDQLVLAEAIAGLAARHPSLQVVSEVMSSSPSAALIAIGQNARLVVVGSRGRHGLKRLLLGSVSEDVVHDLPTVVAVVLPARDAPQITQSAHRAHQRKEART